MRTQKPHHSTFNKSSAALFMSAVLGFSACSSSDPAAEVAAVSSNAEADAAEDLANVHETPEEKSKRLRERSERYERERRNRENSSGTAPSPTPSPTPSPSPAPTPSPTPEPAPAPGGAANHAGRILPAMPQFSAPVQFGTLEADAILAAMQIMPKNSAWNEDISRLPVLAESGAMINQIGAGSSLRFNQDMNFVIVPPNQPKVNFSITLYPGESDLGPFPIPDITPIESWPIDGTALSATQAAGGGDRHAIVVDPLNQKIYEMWQAYKLPSGWTCSNSAVFDLDTNRQRPLGWTSSDAAGLPIFPAIVRYDELARGSVEHALRFTVPRTRREFIYPASHVASNSTDPTLPAMGQRFRLKASANLAGLSPHALAVAKALQKYGMIVADNGGAWRISVAPDPRIIGMGDLARFVGSDFEVIQTTGEFGGPRVTP
jgi:hypothetical protein